MEKWAYKHGVYAALTKLGLQQSSPWTSLGHWQLNNRENPVMTGGVGALAGGLSGALAGASKGMRGGVAGGLIGAGLGGLAGVAASGMARGARQATYERNVADASNFSGMPRSTPADVAAEKVAPPEVQQALSSQGWYERPGGEGFTLSSRLQDAVASGDPRAKLMLTQLSMGRNPGSF